jgi:hypothetical protein
MKRTIFIGIGVGVDRDKLVLCAVDVNRQRCVAKTLARKQNDDFPYGEARVFRLYDGTPRDFGNWLAGKGCTPEQGVNLTQQLGALLLEIMDRAGE